MSEMHVVAYDASYKGLASDFCCGNTYLDSFLKHHESLDAGFGKTYVLLSDDESAIIGYYNIGVGYIEDIGSGTPSKLGGSIHINCFAVDQKFQGLLQDMTEDGIPVHLSDILLQECIARIRDLRKYVGFAFITLCSTRRGYHLYDRNQFYDLDADMNFSTDQSEPSDMDNDDYYGPMYLPLDEE